MVGEQHAPGCKSRALQGAKAVDAGVWHSTGAPLLLQRQVLAQRQDGLGLSGDQRAADLPCVE